jgi:transposase
MEKILAPILSPGDVVVLDNLGSHKGNAARAIFRAKGAHLIFLPPYSPDLNPIEQVFGRSNISSERLSPVTSKPLGERSASSSTSSLQPSAPTTSLTPDTVPSK